MARAAPTQVQELRASAIVGEKNVAWCIAYTEKEKWMVGTGRKDNTASQKDGASAIRDARRRAAAYLRKVEYAGAMTTQQECDRLKEGVGEADQGAKQSASGVTVERRKTETEPTISFTDELERLPLGGMGPWPDTISICNEERHWAWKRSSTGLQWHVRNLGTVFGPKTWRRGLQRSAAVSNRLAVRWCFWGYEWQMTTGTTILASKSAFLELTKMHVRVGTFFILQFYSTKHRKE